MPRFWNAKNGSMDVSDVSIVPLGERHINHFWRLLNDLHIPHITLLDLDKERDGGCWGRIKYVLDQLIQNGYDRTVLLNTEHGVLSDKQLDEMSEWDITNTKVLQRWMKHLEDYNVFFSTPLDVDFLMLEHYEVVYKGLIGKNQGPRLMIEENAQKIYQRN